MSRPRGPRAAYDAAVRRLIDAHPNEFQMLLAEEKLHKRAAVEKVRAQRVQLRSGRAQPARFGTRPDRSVIFDDWPAGFRSGRKPL